MEGGQEFPFLVDTGAPVTVLEKSFEPRLGKCLGQSTLNWWNGDEKSSIYAAPRLYLGRTRLRTADKIFTSDLHRGTARATGILGMDCLRNYCLQMDFATGQMVLTVHLPTDKPPPGHAFPLTFSHLDSSEHYVVPTIQVEGLTGQKRPLLIDTGCRLDGLAGPGTVQNIAVFLPEAFWEGEDLTNLVVATVNRANVLGLSFLARHLVTLDFPNRTFYLKQVRSGPLANDVLTEMKHADQRIIFEAYKSLREKGQLPGLSLQDNGAVYLEENFGEGANSVRFGVRQQDDLSVCHYQARRESTTSPWRLLKSWRTDRNGRTIATDAVP
jgi:hypothetical protein